MSPCACYASTADSSLHTRNRRSVGWCDWAAVWRAVHIYSNGGMSIGPATGSCRWFLSSLRSIMVSPRPSRYPAPKHPGSRRRFFQICGPPTTPRQRSSGRPQRAHLQNEMSLTSLTTTPGVRHRWVAMTRGRSDRYAVAIRRGAQVAFAWRRLRMRPCPARLSQLATPFTPGWVPCWLVVAIEVESVGVGRFGLAAVRHSPTRQPGRRQRTPGERDGRRSRPPARHGRRRCGS